MLTGARRTLTLLARYHRHRVHGLEHVPAVGPAIVAVNHSLCTYDVGLLTLAVFEGTGRMMRGLGDRSLFTTPGIRRVVPRLGVVEADPHHARSLLDDGQIVVVAPGGMREAIRPSSQRYQVQWQDRLGFVRLAFESGAPLILAASPRSDDVFTVYESDLTRRVYDAVRLPVPVVRGLGLSAVPRPIALTHHLEPVPVPPGDDETALHAWHAQVQAQMATLMQKGLQSAW